MDLVASSRHQTYSSTISDAVKAGVPGITSALGAPGFSYWFQYHAANDASAMPKANLSILFFDERFNFVPESSQQVRVATPGNGAAPLVLSNIKAPKNGYCFVYISNESSELVYFDDLQVRHDRGRILEENHYYATGLKIAPLSSKAFGGAPNNYQYQGAYSEFDDDLGWNDFMLRSFDPQIGRFLQHDPYDQFASGYVGMGNDFGNMVDPTGGWGIGPGIGCAATAGMSGFGGMAGRISGASNMVSVISTVATVGNMAMRGGGIVGSAIQQKGIITQSLQFGSGSSGRRGHSLSADEGGGSAEEDGGDGCPDCPKGYGPKPVKGGSQKPYFQSVDDAARYWSIKSSSFGKTGVELSSLIYSITVSGGNKLYSTTPGVSFPERGFWEKLFGLGDDPTSSSPGLSPAHLKLLPNGTSLVGHIHLHPYGTGYRSQGTGSDNRKFSGEDRDIHKRGDNGNYYWYVLGSSGQLWAKYPKLPDQRTNTGGLFHDPLSENYSTYPIGTHYYNFIFIQTPLCPCYKQ